MHTKTDAHGNKWLARDSVDDIITDGPGSYKIHTERGPIKFVTWAANGADALKAVGEPGVIERTSYGPSIRPKVWM